MTSMFALLASSLIGIGGQVTEVAITPVSEKTSVFIAVEGTVEYRDFAMEGPHRLVVDLIGSTNALPRNEFPDLNRGGIRSIRASQYSEDIVRVVLELTAQMEYQILETSNGVLLTIDNPVGAFAPWSSGSAEMTAFDPTILTPAAPPAQQLSQAERISVTWVEMPLRDVLLAFAAISGKSILPSPSVTGTVTAEIVDKPWDVAMRTILSLQGLMAEEDEYGIIRIDNIADLATRAAAEPIETVPYRISYATASELQAVITPLLTPERGQVSVGAGTNTLIVSDIGRVQNEVARLLSALDVETPQVSIHAKIIFVNRTDLAELGVSYEIKDSQGNQINNLSSGAADLNADGTLTFPDEVVEQGESVVALGGNSVAALGNAASRVGSPTLQLLTSLVIGRHQLVSFIDALQTVNLSDIEAEPQVTVLDNQPAELFVGELTPIRTIDAGAGATAGGTFPTAQVTQQETGIILRATPHVTAGGNILLELSVERSAAELAESDAGFIFRTQRGTTRVLVEDGETTSIAGLSQSEYSEARSGIPLLMDLPLIGRLFRTTREQELQRDLIILVTPHIVRGTN